MALRFSVQRPAEGEEATEKAMTLLRQTVATGYISLAKLRTDTDLDPLRQREDLQKLMRELEEKTKTLELKEGSGK
jgi:hypothetical protein